MFKEATGNAWTFYSKGAFLCVNLSGTIVDGQTVAGAGIHEQVSQRWPRFRKRAGSLIRESGLHTYYVGLGYIAFPVKHEVNDIADVHLIQRSFMELIGLMGIYNWKHVVLPRPGCGNGHLDWETQVRPALEEIVYSYAVDNPTADIDDPVKRITIISNGEIEKQLAAGARWA